MELIELQHKADEEKQRQKPVRIRVCTAASCLSSNAQAVKDALDETVKDQSLEGEVQVCSVGCMKLCCEGPMVGMDPAEEMFGNVSPLDSPALLDAARQSDFPLAESLVQKRISPQLPFFEHQQPIVLENSGIVEPERIESYLASGGYQALHHALWEMTPAQVLDEVRASGLRGRGGGGYPTGVKWELVAKTENVQKYVICNADEGDPGAFMDRSVLESDPHRILEGMALAAYAVGANQGYVYVRGEYPLAIYRLETAIRQAKRLGVLGAQVFDSPFDFRIDIRIGAGAFVCGEETALINSIEGKRGTPRPRPPYPAESGLWECPTLINNVETFANVPAIIRNGSEWFRSIGTEGSKGTKVFALAGKIRYTGLVEVPMGTSLRQIVDEMGGGAPEGGTIKAVQTGGPSGGCIPEKLLDTPVDYESLKEVGSIMGSGGMIAMDETTDMVGVAKYFMEFSMEESCGKCIPCRAGTVQLYNLLSKIEAGDATADDLEKLKALSDMVKHTSLCGLGQSAPNPVLSTLHYFDEEYLSRLRT